MFYNLVCMWGEWIPTVKIQGGGSNCIQVLKVGFFFGGGGGGGGGGVAKAPSWTKLLLML